MSRFRRRLDALVERARADRAAFDPPANPPDEERARSYLREGFGPLVALYLDARTGGDLEPITPGELDRLHDAMHTWLELYAACYGVDLEPDATVRAAGKALMDTHDVHATAQVLTHVPERDAGSS